MNVTIDPRRKNLPIRPFKAIGHMRKLLTDHEDTQQVFQIMECLNGDSLRKRLIEFSQTSKGAAVLQRRRELPPILDNHDWLRQLPANSVGQAYLTFMEREGLSATGLVEESEKWWSTHIRFEDDLEFFARRYRDTHDLLHILTGYGRDQLGETSVLAFSHAQLGGFGNLFIAYIGAWDLTKTSPRSVKIMASIREARRHGKICRSILEEDIVELLKEPLETARARMNIAEPKAYKTALSNLQAIGYQGQLSSA